MGNKLEMKKERNWSQKKSIQAKEQIKKYSKDFQGTLTDMDAIKLLGISRNSYYKYKREIVEEHTNRSCFFC